MKYFALFLLVALVAVAMGQEEPEPVRIANLPLENPRPDPAVTPESGEIKRDKRGYFAYSSPYHYGGGYNTYSAHYRAPYAYYQTYPQYGYRSNYYYY